LVCAAFNALSALGGEVEEGGGWVVLFELLGMAMVRPLICAPAERELRHSNMPRSCDAP
jgi:hypothetical protein